MFFFRVKVFAFIFASLFFSTSLTGIVAKDESDQLDFEMILAGIKYYDDLVRSGEGKCTLTWEQFTLDSDREELNCNLVFDRNRIRMECEANISRQNIYTPKETVVSNSSGTWEILYLEDQKPMYMFKTSPELSVLHTWSDPRRWLRDSNQEKEDLPTYMKGQHFRIEKQENLNDIFCYVLITENAPETSSTRRLDKYERFWISPEQGFRYLKRENRFPVKKDNFDIDPHLKKGSPYLIRMTASYKQYGEAWFPKICVAENIWIDSHEKEHVISRMTLEIKDLKLNHAIPLETFIVDIPDDAMIHVQGLRQALSKMEFLQRYKQE